MKTMIYTQRLEPEQKVCLASGKNAIFCAYISQNSSEPEAECEIEVGQQKLRLPQNQIFLPTESGPGRRWRLGQAEIEWFPENDHLIYRGPIVALSPDGLWYHRQRFYRNEELPKNWDQLEGWALVQNWLWRLNPDLSPPKNIQVQLEAAFHFRNPQAAHAPRPTESLLSEVQQQPAQQAQRVQQKIELKNNTPDSHAIAPPKMPAPSSLLRDETDQPEVISAHQVDELITEAQNLLKTQADDALLQASQKELDHLNLSSYPPSLQPKRVKTQTVSAPVEVQAEASAFETMISEQVKAENKSNPLKTLFFLFLGFMIVRSCISAFF